MGSFFLLFCSVACPYIRRCHCHHVDDAQTADGRQHSSMLSRFRCLSAVQKHGNNVRGPRLKCAFEVLAITLLQHNHFVIFTTLWKKENHLVSTWIWAFYLRYVQSVPLDWTQNVSEWLSISSTYTEFCFCPFRYTELNHSRRHWSLLGHPFPILQDCLVKYPVKGLLHCQSHIKSTRDAKRPRHNF